MSIPDSFAPYVYILVLLALALALFFLYRLWQFTAQTAHRLTHRRPKTVHLSDDTEMRLVSPREWTVEPEEPQESKSEELSSREIEVALLARDGLSNKAIARELHISIKTVETHMTSIGKKLHIRSRKELKHIPRDLLH